ncbi:NYN domain-containing protein [Achromobacter ruhlandii]|uniref:NYN domain-containing protein n=1 Tax=Achromobacter ruhlandii TaxID=72557 RepID=UPI0022B8DBCE|nr:NYN domain-containing protein [Achromobacter ruhlandii]MCZ8435951.1 NYN domain-containing protein [Achromobacter ruhlandii]
MNANENVSMALFCDFENVALGVRDTKYQKFDIRPVLERLLLKGSIVVKKAYCDWERYKEFKAPMHEANFELIEIPHVRQSGKNSADIRLVVDALDFCYTKSHVNTFVIISGDSDFSPLVSKLRENNKKVIGVGVKQSTSDLLIANCDEFIFYDDLAREGQRAADARRDNRGGGNAGQRRSPDEERRRKEELEARKTQAVDMVVETFEALMAERGDSGKIWASALKDALKRRRPDFNESYYGFRAFGNLLDEAQSRGFLEVGREEKSGTYVYRDNAGGAPAGAAGRSAPRAAEAAEGAVDGASAESEVRSGRGTRGARKNQGAGRGGRQGAGQADGRAPTDMEREAGEDALAAQPAPQPRSERQEHEARQDRQAHQGRPARQERPAHQDSQAHQDSPAHQDQAGAGSPPQTFDAPAPAGAPDAGAAPFDAPPAREASDAVEPADAKRRRTTRGGRGAAKTARAGHATPAPAPGKGGVF